jgi:ribose transport system permease protein
MADVEDTNTSAATPVTSPLGRRSLLSVRPEVMILAALAIIVVTFTVAAPTAFLNPINIRNIAVEASFGIILALGMTFVIITAGIDLSVGAVVVLSSVVAVIVMRQLGVEHPMAPLLGFLSCMAVALVFGIVNGLLIAKARLNPLIVTLATMGIGMGAARLISGGVDLTGVPPSVIAAFGTGRVWGIPAVVFVAVGVLALGVIGLHATRFGLHTYAIGSNEQAARRSGLKVERHIVIIYVICALCAGLAGYLSLGRFASTTIAGHTTDNLKAITAVVLGGVSLFGGSGTLFGTTVGVFIPVTLASGLVIVGLTSFWQEIAVGIVLLLAVLLDQFRRRSQRR